MLNASAGHSFSSSKAHLLGLKACCQVYLLGQQPRGLRGTVNLISHLLLQGSAGIAQAALSTAVLRIKDLKAFQDKLEVKQRAGAASAQAWFDDLAAQAKDQYEIFQVSHQNAGHADATQMLKPQSELDLRSSLILAPSPC